MHAADMTKTCFLPHDLLWLSCVDEVIGDGVMPDWAKDVLSRTPVAVVRRALCAIEGRLSIGLRGPTRSQRYAATVPTSCVCKRVAPEDLVVAGHWPGLKRRSEIAAIWSLEYLIEHCRFLDPTGRPLTWGPTGSVGFELATGMLTARPDSDLDLILRAPFPLTRVAAAEMLKVLAGLPVKVDVQMETPLGCVILYEYAHSKAPSLVLRTSRGPRLAHNPWSIEQGENA